MRQHRSNVLWEWTISYIFAVLIPICTIFLNYHFDMKVIKEEIYKANEVVLDNISGEIEQIINTQKRVYSWLYTNEFFNSWITHEEKTAEFYYDASRLETQLHYYLMYSDEIDCLIFDKNKNYVVGKEFANDAYRAYLSLAYQYKDYDTYDDWLEKLSDDYNGEIFFAESLNINTDQKCLVYADSLRLKDNKPVNVFISVPLEQIADFTETLKSRAYLVIANKDNVEIVNGDEALLTLKVRECIYSDQEIFETESFMGMSVKSSNKDISYCLLIDKTDFWQTSEQVKRLFMTGLVMTLIVTGLVIAYLLRKNFMPVSRLVEKTVGKRERGNEFYQIELSYKKLKNENSSMQQILQVQKSALLGNYILAVMKGRKNQLSDHEKRFFDLDENGKLLLCGFCLDMSDELLCFSVDNIFSELVEGRSICKIEDGNYIFYLFLCESEEETDDLSKQCDRAAQYMCDFFLEKWSERLEFYKISEDGGINKLKKVYEDFMLLTEKTVKADMTTAKGEVTGIVADVLDYIKENYRDSSLNVAAIADAIGKNPKYMSRVFKESMGEGILDHLNRIRIEKAKEIIATRKYTIEEAGALAGYASNQTFRRTFIKLVGITPGKYMEKLQN